MRVGFESIYESPIPFSEEQNVCFVCSVKPEVLDEIAPVMRKLQGHSVCVHARVDDKMSGFTSNEEIKVSQNDTDALLWNAKPLFDCAEVGSIGDFGEYLNLAFHI